MAIRTLSENLREVTFVIKKKVVDGKVKKKGGKAKKPFLDFTIISDYGTGILSHTNYTAHVYSNGRDEPEIRISDKSGTARDPGKPVSYNLAEFPAKTNTRFMTLDLRGQMYSSIHAILDGKLAESIFRFHEKKRKEAEEREARRLAA